MVMTYKYRRPVGERKVSMQARRAGLVLLSVCCLSSVWAQSADTALTVPVLQLKEAAQKAVSQNPDVLSRWHAFRAAGDEEDAARGGYLPKLDVSAGAGRESLKQPLQADTSYSRRNYGASLSQMLFDGFATSSEVKRLGKAKLARYYELLDASENTALETAKAHYDVMRYRFLVSLAEDNYVQHKATYELLMRRTQAGVGRRADMEQAGSRLALAESNLVTELANLHDVTTRYQRVVGALPPKQIVGLTRLGQKMPGNVKQALEWAYTRNPGLMAAVEGVESAQYAVEGRRSAYLPRLDLRARSDNVSNYQGVEGERRNNVVEVVLNYNLFNGGSDRARERMSVEQKNSALDQREKVCRDVRQNLLVAFNDLKRLREQQKYLETQVSLLERSRDAYREQFNVGQRTLLDLLDTDNELLNARRAAINADVDQALASLRIQAAMGTLLEYLGLKQIEDKAPDTRRASVDTLAVCPMEQVVASEFDRATLNARASNLVEEGISLKTLPALAPKAMVANEAAASASASPATSPVPTVVPIKIGK